MIGSLIFFLLFAGAMAWVLRSRLVLRNIWLEPDDPRFNDRDWNPVAFWTMNAPVVGGMMLGLAGAAICVTDMAGITEFFAS